MLDPLLRFLSRFLRIEGLTPAGRLDLLGGAVLAAVAGFVVVDVFFLKIAGMVLALFGKEPKLTEFGASYIVLLVIFVPVYFLCSVWLSKPPER